MESMILHILGCGSALPTVSHGATSQALVVRGKIFLIDCGEGCQLMLRRQRLSFSRIVAIFISHLHGDHIFGLPGLLGSLALLGRTGALHIYGPRGIADFVDFIRKNFLREEESYPIEVHEHDAEEPARIFDDQSMRVSTLPLRHRIPTTGYLFEEKCPPRHLNKAAVDFYGIPIVAYPEILMGMPYRLPDGREIPNRQLTFPGRKPRRYAFCSDTCYHPPLSDLVKGVDLLYHESTYAQTDKDRASRHYHSTSRQAAMIARDAQVKRLLLGHYSSRYHDLAPLLQEAREVFDNCILSNEGMTLEL